MAMSFARPDPSSPASVADAGFAIGRRGFDQGEVRDFLRMVAAELGRLHERERFLERELRTSNANRDIASVEMDELTLTRLLGEETARVLTTARESGAQIRQKAEQSAAQMLTEASDEAARLREEAEVEASRRRSDAAADAEAELSMAKQQGREMVNEARAYRERVLSELARRRELAREQIEQLLHGRDRLMQSFERARLVAVDVVAELQPIGEPDEYVNLSPTTGPVPVMVPNSPRPAVAPVERPDAAAPAETAQTVVDDTDDTDAIEPIVETVDVVATDTIEEAMEADPTAATVEASTTTITTTTTTTDEVDGVDQLDEVDEVDVMAEVVEPVDPAAADAEPTIEAEAIERRDDVVVDLFARLRADSSIVVIDDTGAEPEPVPDNATVSDTSDELATANEATPFDQRDADLTPLIVASAKKLKRVLADEQNEVLDALRRSEPVRELADLLPAQADHLARFRVAIVDDLLAAANAGASLVTPGRVALISRDDAARAAKAGDAVLDEWLIVPLRERLDRCVADGDGDNAGIAKRVRAVYREWKTQHIDEQLDDVIRTAHGSGLFSVIDPGTAVDWVSDPSHDACADCNDNTLGGAVAAGVAFPTGHLFPPAHLGCRCLLLPAER